jgi:hypothetical protein
MPGTTFQSYHSGSIHRPLCNVSLGPNTQVRAELANTPRVGRFRLP